MHIFNKSIDLFVAYVMANIHEEAERTKARYEATEAYTKAVKKWDELPDHRGAVWRVRFDRLKGGDADMLHLFGDEDDMKIQPPTRCEPQPRSHGASTDTQRLAATSNVPSSRFAFANGGFSTFSNITRGPPTYDGTKVKAETEDDDPDATAPPFQAHIAHRPSRSPAPQYGQSDSRMSGPRYFQW